ncbi:Uncharacterized protein Rs2_51350 [Raphanus sativus]|nr:Uncharacterized protein Rs2_51350 [Raphanus sativus]
MSEANQASPAQDAPALTQNSSRGSVLFRTRWSDAVLRWSLAWQVLVLLPFDFCGSIGRFNSGSRGSGSWTRRYSSPDLHNSSLWIRCPFACWRNCRSGASTRCPGSSGGLPFSRR